MHTPHLDMFETNLRRLSALLEKIAFHSQGKDSILNARLAEDMFPLAIQVVIAANFALRAACPIAGEPVTLVEPEQITFADLRTMLTRILTRIKELDNQPSDLTRRIKDKAGPAEIDLPAQQFLDRFAIPNFYFHFSMIYAIARAEGIPLTKGDFDGLHQYPDGFSF